jgi:hypothetical protein
MRPLLKCTANIYKVGHLAVANHNNLGKEW